MKAGEDIVIVMHKKDKNQVPYKEGDSKDDLEFHTIKMGSQIPDKYLKRLAERNLELIGDVVYKDKYPINLPKGILTPPEVPTEMKIKKRKYTQDSLTQIYNEGKFSALKKIGQEFGVTDRSSRRLIVEILRAQEEKQRTGL